MWSGIFRGKAREERHCRRVVKTNKQTREQNNKILWNSWHTRRKSGAQHNSKVLTWKHKKINTKEYELYYKQSVECRRKSWRHGGWDKCTIQGTSDNSCVAMALGNTQMYTNAGRERSTLQASKDCPQNKADNRQIAQTGWTIWGGGGWQSSLQQNSTLL